MVSRIYQRRVTFLWITIVIILSFTSVVSLQQQQQQSEADVCDATSNGSVECMTSCHHDTHRCTVPSTIYESSSSSTSSGKSAMAYVPNIASTQLPTATTTTTSTNMVCDTTSESLRVLPYRVATWPLSRSTIRNVAPILQIQINLFTCQSSVQSSTIESSGSSSSSSHSIWSYLFSSKNKKKESDTTGIRTTNKCCCQPYHSTENIEIELWQTRPDGTYPSLLSAYKNGNTECRARYIMTPTPLTIPNNNNNNNNDGSTSKQNNHTSTTIASSSFVFHTLAPGSTGVMNGLGPKRWDIPPYGPPVIHMMIHTKSKSPNNNNNNNNNNNYTTLFMDVPILISKTTLESTKFYGSDYRGPAWVTTKSSSYHHRHRATNQELYQITQWESQPENNLVRIEMDVFVPQHHHDNNDDNSRTTTTTIGRKSLSRTQLLCPSSYWYGFPTSFFIEPIAVCAPSLLDFFHL